MARVSEQPFLQGQCGPMARVSKVAHFCEAVWPVGKVGHHSGGCGALGPPCSSEPQPRALAVVGELTTKSAGILPKHADWSPGSLTGKGVRVPWAAFYPFPHIETPGFPRSLWSSNGRAPTGPIPSLDLSGSLESPVRNFVSRSPKVGTCSNSLQGAFSLSPSRSVASPD